MRPETRNVLLRGVTALASAALTLVAVELIGAVGLHYAKRKPELPSEVEATVATSDRSVATVSDPYLLLRVKPNLRTPLVRTNRFGLRNEEIDARPPPDTLRILFLGGSVAWGYAARSNEETLPTLLESYLRSQRARSASLRGRRIEVLNGGVPSYVAWQGALSYSIYHRQLRPDVVISLDGVNEVYAAVRNGRAGWPMRYSAARYAHLEPKPTLAGSLWSWLRYRVERMKFNRMLRELRPRPLERYRPPGAAEVADAYRSALEHLADVAAAEGALAVPVLQPMSILPGAKPLAPYESAMVRHHESDMPGTNDYHRSCFEAFRRMFDELAASRPRLLLVDATAAFSGVDDVAFTDHCHLTLRGRERLAEWIGEALIAQLDGDTGERMRGGTESRT